MPHQQGVLTTFPGLFRETEVPDLGVGAERMLRIYPCPLPYMVQILQRG